MHIILTKHSKQRRDHYPITPDEKIIPWIKYFDELFEFKSKEDSVYKITYKQKAAVLEKKGNKLILITIRGFEDFEKRETYPLRINNQNLNNKIYRKDYLGKLRHCGNIDQNIFSLKRTLKNKYKIDLPNHTEQMPISKLEEYAHFNEEEDKWMLNNFDRHDEYKIWRVRKNGILVSCGRLLNNRINLGYDLLSKYKFDHKVFFSRSKELDKLIHYDEIRKKNNSS